MSRALLLVGSPKPQASASRTFAEAVGARVAARGWETRIERIAPAFSDTDRMSGLLAAIGESDLIIIAFPVYVDSLPAPVLKLLQTWKAAVDDGSLEVGTGGRLAVLTQCGFPEANHCDVAVETCRLFAEEVGIEWAGALAFGMGGAIEGGSIERSPLAKRLSALDAAAEALAEQRAIPQSARDAFARPLAPGWLYPLVGGLIWRRQARRRGCTQPITSRRYAQ